MNVVAHALLTLCLMVLFVAQVAAKDEPDTKSSGNHASDQTPSDAKIAPEQKGTHPASPEINLMGLLTNPGGLKQTAKDFRMASEAMERFGKSLEELAPKMIDGVVASSENHAAMSRDFDPLGLKAAIETIQKQSETIQALQQAEIDRLKEEVERLKKP